MREVSFLEGKGTGKMCIRDRQRKQRSQEEAKKVVFAGKSKKKPVKAHKSINNTGEKISTITFRCTVKEHNFKEVNARLSLVPVSYTHLIRYHY